MLDDDLSNFKSPPFVTRDLITLVLFLAIGLGILKALPWSYEEEFQGCVFPPGGVDEASLTKQQAIVDSDEEPSAIFKPPAY